METPSPSPLTAEEVHRIEISVDWPPGHVSVYLIDGPEPVLLDAGMPGETAREELEEGLATLERSLADVDHLVLTHPHVDHIGQVETLVDVADPTIYAPTGVEDRLVRSPSDLETVVEENAAAAGLRGTALDEAVTKSVESLKRNQSLLDTTVVDRWIDHEEVFTVGGVTLRAVHTPGHQADHFSYLGRLEDGPVLFSGDLLLEPFRAVMIHTGLDAGVEEAVDAFYTALDRLDRLEADHVLPGHGPVHRDLHGMVDRSRRSIDGMLADAREKALAGPITALELAVERSGEREIHYVLPEVVSAFAHLEAAGEIAVTVKDGVNTYHAPES